MKILSHQFKVPGFFGDNDWHTINLESSASLSVISPFAVLIGVTTTIPSVYGSCTKIKSNYLWRHSFTSTYSDHWSNSSYGSNGSTAVTSLGVGVTNTSTYYDVCTDQVVSEGYITSSTDGRTVSNLYKIRFYSYNNWYFNTDASIVYPTNAADRAIAVKFAANYEADLPTDAYTVSGNIITWNDSSVVRILYGKQCTPY